MKIPDEWRERFLAPDPNEKAERILTEIMLGVPISASSAVEDDDDRVLWDKLVANIAELPEGTLVEYDVPAGEDV